MMEEDNERHELVKADRPLQRNEPLLQSPLKHNLLTTIGC